MKRKISMACKKAKANVNIDVSHRYKVSENCLKVSEKSGESQGIFNFLIRDGPLEKLWGGGVENFRAAGIFFRYQIRFINFFLGHSMNIFKG